MALPKHLEQFNGFVDLIVAYVLKEIEAATKSGEPTVEGAEAIAREVAKASKPRKVGARD